MEQHRKSKTNLIQLLQNCHQCSSNTAVVGT